MSDKERIEQLENAIKEFLSHSMEFSQDVEGYTICPICGANQLSIYSSGLKHSNNCYFTKLAKVLDAL